MKLLNYSIQIDAKLNRTKTKQVKFYKDNDCTLELEDAEPIVSAASSGNPVQNAFDIDESDPQKGMDTYTIRLGFKV